MTDHRKRSARIEETRKTADNHFQRWTAQEDEQVLHSSLGDFDLAIALGRTVVAVSQRRVTLKKLITKGMSIEDIHETETILRQRRNAKTYQEAVIELRQVCPECFCFPHSPICSRGD